MATVAVFSLRCFLSIITSILSKSLHGVAYGAYTYEYVMPKRSDLKTGIDAYLISKDRQELITDTPRSDEEIFTPLTSQERLTTIFADIKQKIVVCGHTHMQFERQIGSVSIVNSGSVGMPFAEEPGAYWLLLSPMGYEFRRTIYDFEAAANEVRASEDPQRDEFAEGNMLRIPTASEAAEFLERIAMKN